MEFFFIGLHESKDIEFLSQGKYFEKSKIFMKSSIGPLHFCSVDMF